MRVSSLQFHSSSDYQFYFVSPVTFYVLGIRAMIRIDSELLELFKSRNSWATEIIIGMLWLGSGGNAQNHEILIEKDIKYVLNVSDDVPNFFEDLHQDGIKYLKLNVGDFGTFLFLPISFF